MSMDIHTSKIGKYRGANVRKHHRVFIVRLQKIQTKFSQVCKVQNILRCAPSPECLSSGHLHDDMLAPQRSLNNSSRDGNQQNCRQGSEHRLGRNCRLSTSPDSTLQTLPVGINYEIVATVILINCSRTQPGVVSGERTGRCKGRDLRI